MSFELPKFDPTWKERCGSCLYRVDMGAASRGGALGIRCSAVAVKDMLPVWLELYGRKQCGPPDEMAYCIDARHEGAPCGPGANLWKSKP